MLVCECALKPIHLREQLVKAIMTRPSAGDPPQGLECTRCGLREVTGPDFESQLYGTASLCGQLTTWA